MFQSITAIVEVHDDNAQEAKEILAQADIEINFAANGVFLPSVPIDGAGGVTMS